MLDIVDLDYRYGSQILFHEASARVESGWKVGLIGPNGSGKSTLFRLIMGREKSEVGRIAIPNGARLGYFDQKVGEMHGCDTVEQAIRCAGRVSELRFTLADLEEQMSDPDKFDELDRLMARYAELQNEFQTLGGYDIEPRARELAAEGERVLHRILQVEARIRRGRAADGRRNADIVLEAGQAVRDGGIDQIRIDQCAAGGGYTGAVHIDRLGLICDDQAGIAAIAHEDVGATPEQEVIDIEAPRNAHGGDRTRAVRLAPVVFPALRSAR